MSLSAEDSNVIDELAEYDYFETKRNEHLANLKKIKIQENARAREIVKAKALSWRKNGDAALGSVQGCVGNLKAILMPHNYLKFTLAQMREHIDILKERAKIRSLTAPRQYANRLVMDINPISRKIFHKQKVNVAVWKTVVMHDICLNYILKHPLRTDDYIPPTVNWRTFRNLFRTYMRYVPADKHTIDTLKKKRENLRKVKKKLDLIYSTLENCRKIRTCKSAQHTNHAGCSACGVIYRGGTLNGEEYVASYSRDTGVPTLVTLDFEFETLYNEEAIQIEIIRKVTEDLVAFESIIFPIVAHNIEQWWIFVLAWKRSCRPNAKYRKSTYRFKIRRLVKMKRELDVLILEAAPLDMEYLSEKYCDIIPALKEYATKIAELKTNRMNKWIQRFHDKLRNIAHLVRFKRSQIKPPTPVVYERPIIFKTAPLMDKKHYICFRQECKLRKFLTEDRYNTHMSVHKSEDVIRYARYEANKQAKAGRDKLEKEMMLRIKQSKGHLKGDGVDGGQDIAAHQLVDYSFADNYDLISPPPVYLEVKIVSARSGDDSTDDGTTRPGTADGNNTGNNTARSEGSKLSSLLSAGFDFEARVGSQVIKKEEKEKVDHPKLMLPHSEDYFPDTVKPSTLPWTGMSHVYNLSGLMNSPLYSLEMVSKQGDIDIPMRIPLDQPIIRIGTHASCECVVGVKGAAKREGKISTIHCLLYCSMSTINKSPKKSNSSINNNKGSGGHLKVSTATPPVVEENDNEVPDGNITIVDNSSVWGTYIVSSRGTKKVPTKITAGTVLTPGLLICIGVARDGPEELSATEANAACVVYRVRCLEKEI